MKFHCNLPQTEINFTNSEKKRVTVKFHANIFETEDEETIKHLTGYENQGVLVSIVDADETDKIDYTPVFPDDEPEPINNKKSKKGKR